MSSPQCPFCDRISHGEYELTYRRDVVRFRPLNPVTPGHMLFLPAEHAEHPSPFPLGASMEAAARYAEPGESYNLITSSGMAATQTIAHLHVHFVPRHSDDGLHLPWTGQRARMAAQARQDEAFEAGYLAREQSMSLHTLGMESSDQAERDQAFTRWQQERSNR